jgi:Amt family ammonium transporter
VAGLVGITPAAGFISPMSALALGAIVSGICYVSANLRAKSKLDDSLDAFAVHGVGGFSGAVLTGVFATAALKPVNAVATAGLIEGNVGLVGIQLLAVVATALYAMAVTFVLLKVLDAVMGLRVSAEVEDRGLDITLHGEEAYSTAG